MATSHMGVSCHEGTPKSSTFIGCSIFPAQALLQGAQSGELWSLLQRHAAQKAQSELLEAGIRCVVR